jgi:hypothetical protein
METPKPYRDPWRFTREQLEAKLAKVEQHEYSARFAAVLAKFEKSERQRVGTERRLGNE